MIKVCDRIMGTGKTQATINYLNDHPDGKYIYITPYLDEAERIRVGCPTLDFVEPKRLREYEHSKISHTESLILEGKNITTTHQAFKSYTPKMLEAIQEFGYTLIIDENVSVLDSCDFHKDDLRIAVDAGYVRYERGRYTLVKDNYHGEALREMFWLLRSRQITTVDVEEGVTTIEGRHGTETAFFWVLPPDLIRAFNDVIILTYLFEGQSLHSFLKMYGMEYSNIGIERVDYGTGYRFCDGPGYVPEYVGRIHDMIHIVDDMKINAVGDTDTALSVSWFNKHADGVKALKNNLYNYYYNRCAGVKASEKMWSTYKSERERLKGKGYTNAYTAINLKATNAFRSAKYLAYACNLYMNVGEKLFYKQNGITVNEDAYALSTMVQWIWRSAIRDGEEINLYLPSKRMRRILIDWMDGLGKEG